MEYPVRQDEYITRKGLNFPELILIWPFPQAPNLSLAIALPLHNQAQPLVAVSSHDRIAKPGLVKATHHFATNKVREVSLCQVNPVPVAANIHVGPGTRAAFISPPQITRILESLKCIAAH